MADAAKKDKKEKEGSHVADPIFDQFDKDKSGALDKKEVEAALAFLAKAQGMFFPFLLPLLPSSFSLSLLSVFFSFSLTHPPFFQARRSLIP